MAVRIVCDSCRCIMHVADELRGKRIKCKECGGIVAVGHDQPSLEEGFTDRRRVPPMPPPPVPARTSPRRQHDDGNDEVDDDQRSSSRSRQRSHAERPRSERSSNRSVTPLLIAGGAGLGVLLVVVVVLVVILGSRGHEEVAQAADPAPPAAGQAAANPVNPPANAAPVVPVPLPPLVEQPPAGAALNGEQIYNRMLRSTVWIVASHKIAAQGNINRPLQFQPPQIPRPQMPTIPRPQTQFPRPQIQIPRPQMPRPPFGPAGPRPIGPRMPLGPQPFDPFNPGGGNPGGVNPGAPNPGPFMPLPPNPVDLLPDPNQQSTLTNTAWNGSETLPGYGRLTFQFITNTSVIMVDAQETSRGNYRQNGNSITITFGGGVIYNGTINGDSMAGAAHNGRDNWNWNVAKAAGNAPTNPGGAGMVAKATGSGSLIDRKHRLIVTNVHVVGTSDTVQVYFPDFDEQGELIVHSDNYKKKPGLTGRVVLREPRADLAFIQLERLPENSLVLPIATAKAKVASQVHSVGNPGASKGLWIYSPGKVRQVFKDSWKIFDDIENRMCEYNAMKLETDSAINPGDSGGPLVDDRCVLVGVAHAHSLVANNISTFIEASEVRSLLERYYTSKNDKWAPEPGP
jgi:S1-C subfamily serine protease